MLSQKSIKLKRKIIDLCSYNSKHEASELLGITYNTLTRFIRKYKLQEHIDNKRKDKLSGDIEQGLIQLAQGYETTEITSF